MAAEMRELTEQNMQEFVKEVEKRKIPLHSVLIAQHGNLLFEKYYAPYCRNKLQRMFSVTKSFTSLAIGLLEQEGKISLQDPICGYFPEYLPGRVHPWLAEMTIENMLKMQTCYNMTTYNKTSTTENWVRSFFQTEPTHRPGTLFMYDTSSSHVLCALVEKLTGEKMLDYLKEKLLRQNGFSEESYIIEDPFGTSMGGSGLMATPEDLLRTGCMLLKQEKGSYAARATEPRTATQLDGDDRWYGYQFWIPMEGTFAMLGLGGQIMLAVPEMDLVVVTTADTQGMGGAEQMILAAVREVLLKDCFPENDVEKTTLPVLRTVFEGKPCADFGKKYPLLRNKYGFTWCGVTFSDDLAERGRHATVTFMMYDKAAHAGRSDARVAANVDVFCGSEQMGGGRTAGPRQDMNDALRFLLEKGRTYTFRYENSRGEAAQVTAEVGDAPLTVTGYME